MIGLVNRSGGWRDDRPKNTLLVSKECQILGTMSSVEGKDHVWPRDFWSQKVGEGPHCKAFTGHVKSLNFIRDVMGGYWEDLSGK